MEVIAKDLVSYTVPQRVRVNNIKDKLSISFRVKKTMKDKYIYVTSGDTLLLKSKRLHLAPGEMEVIQIDKEKLNGLKDAICVRVGD